MQGSSSSNQKSMYGYLRDKLKFDKIEKTIHSFQPWNSERQNQERQRLQRQRRKKVLQDQKQKQKQSIQKFNEANQQFTKQNTGLIRKYQQDIPIDERQLKLERLKQLSELFQQHQQKLSLKRQSSIRQQKLEEYFEKGVSNDKIWSLFIEDNSKFNNKFPDVFSGRYFTSIFCQKQEFDLSLDLSRLKRQLSIISMGLGNDTMKPFSKNVITNLFTSGGFVHSQQQNQLIFKNNAIKYSNLFLKYTKESSIFQDNQHEEDYISRFILRLQRVKSISMMNVYILISDSFNKLMLLLSHPGHLEPNLTLIMEDKLVNQKINQLLEYLIKVKVINQVNNDLENQQLNRKGKIRQQFAKQYLQVKKHPQNQQLAQILLKQIDKIPYSEFYLAKRKHFKKLKLQLLTLNNTLMVSQFFSTIVSEILALMLIKSQIIKFVVRFLHQISIQRIPSQSDFDALNDQTQSTYCYKIIGKYSNIGYFLHVEEDHFSQKFSYKIFYEYEHIPLILKKDNNLGQQDLRLHKNLTQSEHFWSLYLMDLLNFIKMTLKCGFNIKIGRQNLFIHNNRMKFKIIQPFTVTKTIQSLKSQFCMISEQLQKLQKYCKYLNVGISNTDRQNLFNQNKNRSQHFASVGQNLKFIFELIKQFNPKFKTTIDYSFQSYERLELTQLVTIYENFKQKILKRSTQQAYDANYQSFFEQETKKHSKDEIIELIIQTRIDTLIFQQFHEYTQLSYGQYLTYSKMLAKRKCVTENLLRSMFPFEDDCLDSLKQMINRISKVKQPGLLKISWKEDEIILKIETQQIQKQLAIFFSQFHPEIALQYFLKLFIPYQNADAEFTQVNLIETFLEFASQLRDSFKKIEDIKVKSPLFLLRHMIIKNKLKKDKFPAPFPILNMLNCLLDASLISKPMQSSYFYEYYINLFIKQLPVGERDHNYLIFIIFLLSIVRQGSQIAFLEQVYQFFLMKVGHYFHVGTIVQDLVAKIYKKNENIHPYTYFSKLRSTEIKQIIRQQVLSRVISNSWLKYERNQYTIGDKLIDEEDIDKIHDNQETKQYHLNRLVGGYSFDVRIFKLTKETQYFKRKHFIHYQGLEQSKEDFIRREAILNRNLLELNYINMKHLNGLFLRNNWRCSAISPIVLCQSIHKDKSHPHYEYLTITSQDNCEDVSSDKYVNPYFESNGFNLKIKTRWTYYQSLEQHQKQYFIKYLFQIVRQASQKGIQLLNLNIFTIKIVFNHERNMHLPQFDELQLGRLYTQRLNLKQENTRLYRSYFEMIKNAKLRNKYIQNDFSISNYPPYHMQLVNDQKPFLNTKYDVGNIGLYIFLLISFQNHYLIQEEQQDSDNASHIFEQKSQQSSFTTSFSNIYSDLKQQYGINDNLSLQELNVKLMSIYSEISINILSHLPNILCKLLKGVIHPKIEDRFSLQDAQKYLSWTNYHLKQLIMLLPLYCISKIKIQNMQKYNARLASDENTQYDDIFSLAKYIINYFFNFI